MKSRERGDTLVEVLIAITILGIVVSGVLMIMNRSLVSILDSAERTAVRAEVNSQTELLNYLHDKNPGEWDKIKKIALDSATASTEQKSNAKTICKMNPGSNPVTSTVGSFYVDMSTFTLKTGLVKNTTRDDAKSEANRATVGKGIVIDAIYYRDVTVPYFDFYIKACWTPRGNLPDSNSVTIVRIYDVR